MDSVIYLIFAVVYAGLLAWGLRMWVDDLEKGMRYLLLLVTAALVWDNTVIGLGRWIGEGAFLEGLSLSRFWMHALVTPLLTLVSFDLIRRSGAEWAKRLAAQWTAFIFTAALIIYELWTETLPLELKPIMEYGALRYSSAEAATGPPLMVVLVLIPLFTAGIVLWRRRVTKVMFFGTLLMLLGSAIPLPIESSAATNMFELLLISSIWLTIYKVRRARR